MMCKSNDQIFFWFSSSFNGHDEDGALDLQDDTLAQANGGNGLLRDVKMDSHQIPRWLSESTPDEFCVWMLNILHTLQSFENIIAYQVYECSLHTLNLCVGNNKKERCSSTY